MKYLLSLLMFSFCSAATAQSDVFLCVGANGKGEYKNTGTTKGCTKVDLPELTTDVLPPRTKLAAKAADVYVEKRNVILSGEIRQGDAERMASLIAQEKGILRLIVNSPGGDLMEAMRLVDLVKGMHMGVSVAKGGYCVSACFFVFLEGYRRVLSPANEDGTLPPQAKREKRSGVVGIHRPYLKSPNGDVATTKQEEIMRKVRGYLTSKAVPQHLVDEMMARPSNDIYWLNQRDSELIGEYGPGDEEALIAKCGYKRFGLMYTEWESWSEERKEKLDECTFDFWAEQYLPLQRQFKAKLRTGWRPWSGK